MALKAPVLYSNPIWKYLGGRLDSDILFEHRSKGYSAFWLKSKSLELARSLSAAGVQRSDVVVLAVAPGPEFMMIFFACSLLRARVALVDPHMGPAHYESMVRQLSPKWVFIDGRLVLLQEHPVLRWFYLRWIERPVYFPKIKRCKQIVCGIKLPIISSHLRLHKLPGRDLHENQIYPDPGDEEFLIVYTSGTLATPKGVVHSFSSLSHSIQVLLKTFPELEGKAIATHLPHFILLGIRAGMKVHIWKENWSSRKRWKYIQDHQIQVLIGPPAEWMPLLNYCHSKNKKLPVSLNQLLLGSAPVYPSFIRKIRQYTVHPLVIKGIYGMTEHLLIAHADGNEIQSYTGDGTFVGQLFDGVKVCCRPDGEIEVESDQLFKRYLNHDERGTPHRTGDLGEWKGAGLCITGRKKSMIIRRNTNIYPELYEPAILSIQGIQDAALGSFYDHEMEDERIVLAIEADHSLKDEKIKQLLSSEKHRIHADAMPEFIIRMSIPRKGRQLKIDRDTLQKEILCRLKSS